MVDPAITTTDSAGAATTEPFAQTAAPTNDLNRDDAQSASTTAAPASLELDEDFIKRLDSVDPMTLPLNVRQRLEAPFKAIETQKTQTLAEDRKKFEAERSAIFELARKALTERPAATGPTAEDVKRKELQDLAAAGDSQALQQLVQMEAERQIQPVRTQVALQAAAQSARAANPYVVQHWGEIIQTMQQDPVIAKLATMDNYAAADRVMIALGLEHQVRDLVPKYEAAQGEIKALQAKLQAYEKERVTSLPSSTARAGTTSGRPAAGSPLSTMEAARIAWKEMGYPESEFR